MLVKCQEEHMACQNSASRLCTGLEPLPGTARAQLPDHAK